MGKLDSEHTDLEEKILTTATKYTRWADLNKAERIKQFNDRGTERTARGEIRTYCDSCEKPINEGDKYFDINGAKYAHSSCVTEHSNGFAKQRTVITHKMVEEIAKSKTAAVAAPKGAKRGPKPKVKDSTSPTPSARVVQKHATSSAAKPLKRGRKPKLQNAITASTAEKNKPGPKPKQLASAQKAPAINLTEVREALPGAIVTLTITGTVEAVQRALDKLQN